MEKNQKFIKWKSMLRKVNLLLFLFPSFILPMRRTSGLFTRKKVVKVGSAALTFTGHSIAWGYPLYKAYEKYESLIQEPLINWQPHSIDKQTLQFCQDEIMEYDLNPESIAITYSPKMGASRIINDTQVLMIEEKNEQIEPNNELLEFAQNKYYNSNCSDQAREEYFQIRKTTYTKIGYCLKLKKLHELNIEYLQDKAQQKQSFFSSLFHSNKIDEKSIEESIKKSKKALNEIEENLNEIKATIGHELGHFYNKDLQTYGFQFLPLAALVEFIRLGLRKISPIKNISPLTCNILKIPSGCTRLTGTFYLNSLYNQYEERRADDFVRDDITILQSDANFYHKHSNDFEEYFKKSLKEASLKEKIKLIANHRVFRTHPYSSYRAQRIENRIDRLKRERTFAKKGSNNNPDEKEQELC